MGSIQKQKSLTKDYQQEFLFSEFVEATFALHLTALPGLHNSMALLHHLKDCVTLICEGDVSLDQLDYLVDNRDQGESLHLKS